jgi:hypothetical protein
MPWISHPNIKAVLWPGLPGQESGNAFADIVLGKENPSGRIPYTIAKEYADYPVHPDTADTVSNTILVYYKKKILTQFYIFYSFFKIRSSTVRSCCLVTDISTPRRLSLCSPSVTVCLTPSLITVN